MKHCVLTTPTLLSLAAALLPGCSRILASSGPLLDVPAFPSTNAAAVDVLRSFPDQSFERIGAIFVQPNLENPPQPQIDDTLRRCGAGLGADAVVITFDRFTFAGAPACGPIAGGTCQPDYGQEVRATAIRYYAMPFEVNGLGGSP